MGSVTDRLIAELARVADQLWVSAPGFPERDDLAERLAYLRGFLCRMPMHDLQRMRACRTLEQIVQRSQQQSRRRLHNPLQDLEMRLQVDHDMLWARRDPTLGGLNEESTFVRLVRQACETLLTASQIADVPARQACAELRVLAGLMQPSAFSPQGTGDLFSCVLWAQSQRSRLPALTCAEVAAILDPVEQALEQALNAS